MLLYLKGKSMISSKRDILLDFYQSIKDCQNCDLSKTRTRFVFGSGSADAPVLFIGEAPGKMEDQQGKPFVGRAGKVLDELLGSIGFDRQDIFIANVLKCRPPNNRDPRPEEIDACKVYLQKQIEIIDPKIICTLGKYSTQFILNTKAGISSLRGRSYSLDGRTVLPINHPAVVLYTPSKMELLKEDFKRIKERLEQSPDGPDRQSIQDRKERSKQDEEINEQLGFFDGN